MHVDGAAFSRIGKGPYGFHDLVPAQDNACIGHEIVEQIEFLDGEFTGLALSGHPVFLQVQGNVSADQQVPVLGLLPAAPAEDGLDPAQQFHDAEGFGDIIVRPGIQSGDHVVFTGPGGEHDYGQTAGGLAVPELLQDVQAAFSRQHNVQEHQIRLFGFQGLPERGTVRKGFRLEFLAAKGITDQFPDVFIVFHTIDQRHPLHLPLQGFLSIIAHFPGFQQRGKSYGGAKSERKRTNKVSLNT